MSLRRSVSLCTLVLAVSIVSASDVSAQESRADAIAAEQAEKATLVRPYVPSKAEVYVRRLEQALVGSPSGFYPFFGSVYSGGGFTLGAGYRQFTGDRAFLDLHGLYSIKAYKFLELSAASPGHAHDRVDFIAQAGWRDATQVAYHGLGIESPEDRANYRMKQGYGTVGIGVRPSHWTIVGATAAIEDFQIEDGQGSAPPVSDQFTPETAPGLGVNPTYFHTSASAGIDWRPSAGYARRGGLYELTYHNYADRDDTYSFDRLDVQLVQHVPLLRENWVLSFRGAVQTTLDDADAVPYFMMPALGSGRTLRGYTSWRFRDRHSLLMSAEYRWIPNALGFDMSLFYDAGKVSSNRSDLNFDGLKSDVGIGVRFHSPLATPLRMEIAHSSEGTRVVFAGSAAF